ncbi:MAG: prephenate dehydrogenase/arogenate dehydrogenase family protein [Thermoplasmata archaeon]
MHSAASGARSRELGGGSRAGPHDAGGVRLSHAEIEALRADIEDIDAQILGLVARREEVALEIGLVKDRDGLPIRDRSREKQVIASFVRKARGVGIGPVFAEILAELLISDSIKVQKTNRQKDLVGNTALIVGGAGRMGAWFCRRFSNQGANVRVWDPRARLDGYENVKSLRPAARGSDIIVVASPPGVCPEELGAVVNASPKGLVFDICSVKSHIAALLRKAARDGVTIASVHPMFGPSVPTPRGQTILLCDCGSKKGTSSARKLFAGTGANVLLVDLDRHDQLMAYVLGLSHLCSLLFARTLATSEEAVEELRRVQGPSFGKMLKTYEDLSRESVRVYHDIQALNPHTGKMIAIMEKALQDIKRASADIDHGKFRSIMESNRKHLGVG